MRVVDVRTLAGFDWIRHSWVMFLAQPIGWISLLSCWAILTMTIFVVVPVIGPALGTMLQPGLFAGFMIAARDQEAGVPVTVSQLFAGFRFNGRALLSLGSIALLAELLVMIILSVLGFPRSITLDENGLPNVPAYMAQFDGQRWLIFAATGMALSIKGVLWFATPLLAFHPMRVSHAVRWSFYAFIANFLPLLLFCLLVFGMIFLAIIPMFLGLLVAMPIYALSHYASYQQVFRDD